MTQYFWLLGTFNTNYERSKARVMEDLSNQILEFESTIHPTERNINVSAYELLKFITSK